MQLKKILNRLLNRERDNIDVNKKTNQKIPVLIFCDPGVDDALMLWQILSAQTYQILGIVAGAGNTSRSYTINNAQRIVAITGQTNINIYAGCETPLNTSQEKMLNGINVYGDDGLNGIILPAASETKTVTDGIELACKQINQQSVVIISTGGLTDLYRVLQKLENDCPDKLANILAISMMAGVVNPTQEANAPIAEQRHSEFNILFDITASQGVFRLTQIYQIPVLLVPLDLTHSLLCSQQDAQLFKKNPNAVTDYFYQLLDKVPTHYINRYGKGPDGTMRQPIHDLHASNLLMHPEQYRGDWVNVEVDLKGHLTLEQTSAGNVFLLQFLYQQRQTFFQALLHDLSYYHHLTCQPLLKHQPEIIVFDLDDTLWDCLQHYRYHINNTREKFGLASWTDTEFNQFCYVQREHMFKHMFGENVKTALDYFYQLFSRYKPRPQHARLIYNVEEVLVKLRSSNIRLIAWSNTENSLVQQLIDHFNLRIYFDHVMGSEGSANQWQDLKPNTCLFEQALKKLNLTQTDRSKIWFVGDSLSSDIQCAHNAGCISVWFNPKKLPVNQIKPHYIINQLNEIFSLTFDRDSSPVVKTTGYHQFGFMRSIDESETETELTIKTSDVTLLNQSF